mmetsp:Transcript_2141/g.2336  ORF Transcript_2141/g.2336 Transcript_2141/m.2336 type:complete len:459 (-) Transcript_2141:93-1469(-)
MLRVMNTISLTNTHQRLLVSKSMKFIVPALATTFLSFSSMSTMASATASSSAEDKGVVTVVQKRADRIRGVYFGALVADALCLGSHYEYDAKKIRQAYNGTMDTYMGPGEHMGGSTHGIGWGERNYHPGTTAGDQTDYGEYNVLILEQLAQLATATQTDDSTTTPTPFTVEAFIPTWIERLSSGWKQWVCTQTKQTYQQIQEGTATNKLGGNSNAMALRYAAMYAYVGGGDGNDNGGNDEDTLVEYALKTMFTHREKTALLGNEFFARVVYRLVHQDQDDRGDDHHTITPREAIESVVIEMNDTWLTQKVQQAIAKYEEAVDPSGPLSKEDFVDDLALTSMARLWDIGKSEPIKVGKASPTEGTLPGAIYFILKYQNDFVAAVKANAMVGGDNASRAIAIGMVLGASHGIKNALQDHPALREGLHHWKDSEKLLSTLPLLRRGGTTNDNNNESKHKEL